MTSITVSQSTIDRIIELKQQEKNYHKFLRISVSSGGCSGFQYIFNLDDKISEDDIIILQKESQPLVICDNISITFLQGAVIDFINDLSGYYFKINNPNAKANCGCGTSFSI